MQIQNLQLNHLKEPVGIGVSPCRLTWCLTDGIVQTSFRVWVTNAQNEVILDSGKTASREMHYDLERPLPWRSNLTLHAQAWDETDAPSPEVVLRVVTGVQKEAWQAKWIDPELSVPKYGNRPASYLRKTFTLDAAPSRDTAWLYITAHGLFRPLINSHEITDWQMLPGTQQYNKRLMVVTIDAAEYLRAGENELQIVLGDGWYRGAMGFGQQRNVFGQDIALLAQLEIDGVPVVCTDASWEASQQGPLRDNDFMDGEVYDARLWPPKEFHPVQVRDYGYDNLIPVDTVPVLEHERFDATLLSVPNGETVLDFGVNLVGWVSFDLEAKEGQHIRLIHGESLDGEGNFTTANFQNPRVPTKQEVNYTCCEGRNQYHPSMTYMGFRYVKVEADFGIRPRDFHAVAVYSDIEVTASFSCGNALINRLFENAIRSMKGNFVDVPTDCPTREKSGYSGDCQAFVHTAMYLMDCYPVYAKWIREQAATQYADGVVAQIAPSPFPKKQMMDGGIGWSDSFEIVPAFLAARYGDDALVREVYPQIRKWMHSQVRRAKKTRLSNRKHIPKPYRPYTIDKGWMWGEWLEPGNTDATAYMKDLLLHGDLEVGTAYLFYGCRLTAELAERIGEAEDAAYFAGIAEKAREAYHAIYLPDGKVKEEKRQCRYVRPIHLGLLTPEEETQTAAALAEKIRENGGHLNTGFLTTHALALSLSAHGQTETAYDLLLQEEAPGWLYAVKKGCTAIPESWDCFDENGNPKDSFNHYSYGAICGWLLDTCCGITLENGRLRIAPQPDARLRYARGVYASPVGEVSCAWEVKADGSFSYEITVPANAEAQVVIPGQEPQSLGTGTYRF